LTTSRCKLDEAFIGSNSNSAVCGYNKKKQAMIEARALLFTYILKGSLFAFSCLFKLIFIGILRRLDTGMNGRFQKSELNGSFPAINL